jgi:uncharacterized membrane-anchored protein
MPAFNEYPLREQLNNEIHSRPPMALADSEWVSYLAVLHGEDEAAAEEAHLRQLGGILGAQFCPAIQGDHWVMEAAGLRVKWERHNEFSSYTFFRRRLPGDPLYTSALSALPADWLAALPGRVMVATHIELRPIHETPPEAVLEDLSKRGDVVVATRVADGVAWVYSDFQLHDGYSRFLVLDDHLTRRQAGRTVQRLLEIETYRIMALLAFPVAKEVFRFLTHSENELADLVDRMSEARSSEDERGQLSFLTRLAADVERSVTRTAFRFGAANAYYTLVQRRIGELRELRVPGFPTIGDFMDRRLAPAMATCQSVARRQNELAARVARNSALLRTRVDVELAQQNQGLLAQMNQRAKLQLRLQETVEGLSIVAITYYASQLVTYVYGGIEHFIGGPSHAVITAIAVPVIAILTALGIRRMRRTLAAEERGGH